MAKTYKIGDATIDLDKLIAIGDICIKDEYSMYIPLVFEFNSNVIANLETAETKQDKDGRWRAVMVTGELYDRNKDWNRIKETATYQNGLKEIEKLKAAWQGT